MILPSSGELWNLPPHCRLHTLISVVPTTPTGYSPAQPSTSSHDLSINVLTTWTCMRLTSLSPFCLGVKHNAHFNLHAWLERGGNIRTGDDTIILRVQDPIIASLDKGISRRVSAETRYYGMEILQREVNSMKFIHGIGVVLPAKNCRKSEVRAFHFPDD